MSSLASKVAQLETARAEQQQANAKVSRLELELAAELNLSPRPGAGYRHPAALLPGVAGKRRRTRLTPELKAEILRRARNMEVQKEIAHALGIAHSTVHRFLRHRTVAARQPVKPTGALKNAE